MKRARNFHNAALTLVLLGAVFASVDARADDPAPNDPAARSALVGKLGEEGSAFYKAHDYRHAVEKFVEAYAIDPDPNLLFNIARCYELLGDADAAIEKYNAFLSKPGADPKGRQKAEDSLVMLRKVKAMGATRADASRKVDSTRADGDRPVSTVAAPHQEPPWGTAAWVSLGVGVAAGVAGSVVYYLGANDHSQLTSTAGFGQPGQVASITQTKAQELVDRGTQKKTVGVVLWGVGGAGLVGALIFYALKPAKAGPISVGMEPLKSGGAVTLGGLF